MKQTYQLTGHENVLHEIAGHENDRHGNARHERRSANVLNS